MSTIKFLLVLVINMNNNYSSTMGDNILFENLLWKNISMAAKVLNTDFGIKKIKKLKNSTNFYVNSEKLNKDLYGMNYDVIYIEVDEEELIQSITIYFNRLIDRKFYNAFIEVHGEPDSMQIIENKILESETLLKNREGQVEQSMKRSTFTLREGTFDERPLYITWKKEGYEIKTLMRQQNMSQITYSVKR